MVLFVVVGVGVTTVSLFLSEIEDSFANTSSSPNGDPASLSQSGASLEVVAESSWCTPVS